MISKIKKPVSILLSLIMVFSMFAIVPFTAGATEKTIAEGVIYKLGDTIVLPGDGIYYVKDSERHPAQEVYSNGTITEFEGDEYSYTLMIDEWGIYAHLDTFDYDAEINQGMSVLGITFTGSGTESDPYLPKLALGVFESTWAGEGEGTEDSPWLINDVEDLRTLSANVKSGMKYTGKYLKLMADIDCGSGNWEPIGQGATFGGTFDGNGNTIIYHITNSTVEANGLFSEIAATGTVKNLSVSGSIFSSGNFNGGIAGKNGGLIINCLSTVDITTSKTHSGGIAGSNWLEASKTRYCVSTGTLTWTGTSNAYAYIGGITGENRWGAIDHCAMLGDVLAQNTTESWAYAGILIGREMGSTTDCYYLNTAETAGAVNSGSVTAKTADELKEIGQAAYDAGYTVYGLALGAVASVPYMAWDSTAKQLVEKTGDDACADYTVVADDTTAFEDGKWYVVSEDVTVADRITVSGTANLILCDGKTLTASNGITVETDNTLNIFAQSTGESMGKLTAATTSGTVRNAVIGGVGSNDSNVPATACGTVNIHGGDISTGGYSDYYAYPGAGIGGGGGYNAGDGGTVTIYGGKVTARGGRNDSQNEPAPGIGGGYGGSKGGDGGTVTIYGGTVTATGGIGGGFGNNNGGNGGTVIIYDGTVAAYGDTGIGGGYSRYGIGGNGGNVEIYGGKVTTRGSYTVGIGGGSQNADHGTLTVGRAQLVFGGDSQNPTTIIKKVNNDYARYRFMTVDTRELADDHEHTFVYTASGNTISATCSVENCEFSGLTPITLTLEAPSPAYDGNPKEAVLSGYPDDAPQGLAAAPTGIVYYATTAPGSTEIVGSALSGAPTDAGNYVAQVTWAGETISVPFSVEYSLTINDGTYSYSNFPVYGYNADCYQKSQFVIPASDLTNLQGMTLTEMQFYLSYKASKVWDGTFEVYLGPCDFVLFSNSTFADISEHTKVYTGTLDGTGDTMNVVFDTGYTYTGGNLLVTFFEVEKGAYARANFYGVNDNNLPNYTGIYAYNGSEPTFNSPSGTYFVPKVTIKYSAPEPKDLFPHHSITLGGNIGVNFYIDSAAADFAHAGSAVVKFTWDGGGEDRTKEVDLTKLTPDADGYYKATVDVVAAQMAHKIHAEVYLNGKKLAQTDDYSVQDYAETVYANPAAYDDKGKPEQLKALAKALLNYGAMAQTVFYDSLKEHPALANTVVGNNGYEGVTADQIEGAIKGSAFTVSDVETALGAKFYTSSLIYLSRNTLRLYFTPTTYPGTIPNADKYAGNLSGYYYYVDAANIPAAELDNQQTFNVNGTKFTFSALDYAKAVVESKMEPEQQNLAKALYLYNQAANAYFDAAPAPVENVVDLGTVTEDTVVENGYTITGTLKGDYKISIADGATVTLKDVNITCLSNDKATVNFAGITPLGDATILLEGTNTVKGGYENYPGVFVPVGKTLTIDGTGSLNASSNGYGCGIGGGCEIQAGNIVINGGNIVINGGTIIATGGKYAAGIGSGGNCSCGNITITGGTITANGGDEAAGIGSGYDDATCGNILITGGTVTATGGNYAAGIGSGLKGNCGNITIADTVTKVTATKGPPMSNSIGKGFGGTCGTLYIAPGANVTQN